MKIDFIKPKDNLEWDKNIKHFLKYSFLNSSARKEYLEKIGLKTNRYFVTVDGEIIGSLNFQYVQAKRGNYVYSQHSPLLKTKFQTKEIFAHCLYFLADSAKKLNAVFLRISPLLFSNLELASLLNEMNFVRAPTLPIDAIVTQLIDLQFPKESFLINMRPSARQRVKESLKTLDKNSNYYFSQYEDSSQIKPFLKIHKTLTQFKKYKDRPSKQIEEELQIYAKRKMLYSLTLYKGKAPIAISIFVKYGKFMTYYLSASDPNYRKEKIHPSYLLLYKAMLLAKDLKCKYLDLFGGIIPVSEPRPDKHPWKGLDEFKKGIGGNTVEYIGIYDLPLKPLRYWLMYLYISFNLFKKR